MSELQRSLCTICNVPAAICLHHRIASCRSIAHSGPCQFVLCVVFLQLHLIALNEPFNGDMHGVRGADFACYHQARAAGFTTTFRAFLSSQVQDLDKIVHYGDQHSPVVNLRGDRLFTSWRALFSDSPGRFDPAVPIYSFNRRQVLQDSTWYVMSVLFLFPIQTLLTSPDMGKGGNRVSTPW